MLTKRESVSKFLNYTGILNRVSYHSRIANKNWLTILAYHRVADYDPGAAFDLDEALISAIPINFESQVKWLKQNFSIISFDSLQDCKNIVNPLIITFDDGYKDNYKNAYPILKKYHVPATIFLSTGYIGTSKLFWWDEIAYLMKKTEKSKMDIDSTFYPLDTAEDRKRSICLILALAKRVSDADRKNIIMQLKDKLEVEPDKSQVADIILNWDEIKEMGKNNIEFGAHTVNHPVLANVSSQEVRYEIEESKKSIETKINKEVIVFSYPVGGNASFDAGAENILKEAGYRYAVTYIHGKNRLPDLKSFFLNRIHVEKEDIPTVFKSKVTFPDLIKY